MNGGRGSIPRSPEADDRESERGGGSLVCSPTSTGTRQFRQPQDSVVARHGLERDIRMPPVFPALLLGPRIQRRALVELLRLQRADDAYLIVRAAVLTARVRHRVDVQFRGAGLAGKLAEPLSELFLEIVVQTVLRAEEDDAALGDWGEISALAYVCFAGVEMEMC